MRDRLLIKLIDAKQGHIAVTTAWRETIKPLLQSGKRLTVEVRPEKRSDAQNRLLWATLNEIADQLIWHGNKLSSEDYKNILTAALKKQRVTTGIDGGFVVLGASTSSMTKAEMSELQELAYSFGVENGVVFSEKHG